MSQFQLFPSPTSDARTVKDSIPRGKQKPVLRTPPESIPLEPLRDKSSPTEAVIFKLIEDTHSLKTPPKAHASTSTPVSIPETIQERETSRSPMHHAMRQKRPERVGSPYSTKVSEASCPQSSSSVTTAPAVQMKSMFPRYDFDLPPNQQHYYPEPSSHREHPRPPDIMLSAPEIDRALGPKTVPASVMDFPTGVLDPLEPYSAREELESLWEAANGQRSRSLPGDFHLLIERIDSKTFSFGTPNIPFYTLSTSATNDITITRRNPSRPDSSVPVMNFKLEKRSRRQPPYDGLVAILFPRLAAILAIDQAMELSKELRLPPSEAAEAEGDALKRVAAQESCKLLWNQSKKVYEFQHPALCRQQPPALVGAAGVPLSPMRSKYSGVLHITVSSSSEGTRGSQPPTILVTTPLPANAVETGSMVATPRTSTLPLTDLDEPLASLDLATMIFSISTASIIATVPSLFAIDAVVSAVLAVAASDESTKIALEGLEFTAATPKSQSSSGNTSFHGPFVTTLAELEDAKEGSQLWARIKSVQSSSDSDSEKRWYQFWGKRNLKQPKQPKNRKIVVEEFDMAKYGRYRRGAREGQKLPWITRACLRILFLSLDVIVHVLTLIVKVIAWLMVGMTRCVTSERV
ncbi:proline-rich protein [Aspergillus heteromorphus CBS 117.55]|uniref:Proline-rich protein n=1 Tax=Aspergillus heteromorphus CBS 117.55 TaxID=1448321 RepID=A0A317X0H3_9EURO|nr:proline-rich protein [Aspergillus heteromorphus CBS 117.55]PWY92053.1 proline-rich protein [Aspergillus heteromorphus CBS 117.55]